MVGEEYSDLDDFVTRRGEGNGRAIMEAKLGEAKSSSIEQKYMKVQFCKCSSQVS